MWEKLQPELVRRHRKGIPVATCVQRRRNTILKVGPDYLVVRSDASNSVDRTVTAHDIEHGEWHQLYLHRISAVTRALRCLASEFP